MEHAAHIGKSGGDLRRDHYYLKRVGGEAGCYSGQHMLSLYCSKGILYFSLNAVDTGGDLLVVTS